MLNKGVLNYVRSILKDTIGVVVPIVISRYVANKTSRRKTNVTYSDTIKAVLHSSMLTEDKIKAAAVIPKGKDSAVYEVLTDVVKSSMLSSNKLEMILELCNKEESA